MEIGSGAVQGEVFDLDFWRGSLGGGVLDVRCSR